MRARILLHVRSKQNLLRLSMWYENVTTQRSRTDIGLLCRDTLLLILSRLPIGLFC